MIESTEEFLLQFRAGDYIHALLSWREFLIDKYYPDNQKASADDLDCLILFELINHHFRTDDLIHIKRIYAYAALSNMSEYPAEIMFIICLLSQAALWYQIYEEKGQLSKFRLPLAHKSEIVMLMKQPSHEAENDLRDLFDDRQELLDKDCQNLSLEVNKLKEGRIKIEKLLQVLKEYSTLLKDKSPLREGVLASLGSYLNYALDCQHSQQKIEHFVEQLRQYKPEEWEEAYLEKLSPQHLSSKLFNYGVSVWRFFIAPAFATNDSPPAAQEMRQ